MLKRFPTAERLLSLFNPGKQEEYCKQIARCYQGTAPRIGEVAEVYGDFVAESWLSIQLRDLAEFVTEKKPENSTKVYEELSKIILQEYPRFKLTEFMLFFHEFKAGYYGEFYGTFSPLVVTRALREFKRDRSGYFARIEREEEMSRRKQEWEERYKTKASPEQIKEIAKKYGYEL